LAHLLKYDSIHRGLVADIKADGNNLCINEPADQGFFTEAMMAAIAQSAPEAKQRVRDFLEGKAAKVAKTS
jgi:hypothetical protein